MATKKKPTSQPTVEKKASIKDFDFADSPVMSASVSQSASPRRFIWPAIIVLIVLLVAGYLARNQFIVAMVNGKPIYRHTIINHLEKQSGKAILDQHITETLVQDEARKQGKSITEEQVDQEVQTITQELSTQGQDINMLLAQQGMNQTDLRQQIRLQKLIEQMVPANSDPTEEEIAAALKEQASFFPESMSEQERKTAIVNQIKRQKSSELMNTWLENLRKSASIQYLRSY